MQILFLLVIYCSCALSTSTSDNHGNTVENAATLVKDTWKACLEKINSVEESAQNKPIVVEIKNILDFIEVDKYLGHIFRNLSVDRLIYEYKNDGALERAPKRREIEQNQYADTISDETDLSVTRKRKEPQSIVNPISIIDFSFIEDGCNYISAKFHQVVSRVKKSKDRSLTDKKKAALIVECKKIRNKFIDMLTKMVQIEESSKTTRLVRVGINVWNVMDVNQLAAGISMLKYINKKANRPASFVNAFAVLARQIETIPLTLNGSNSDSFSAIKKRIFPFKDLSDVMEMFKQKKDEIKLNAAAMEEPAQAGEQNEAAKSEEPNEVVDKSVQTKKAEHYFKNPLKNTKQISEEIYIGFGNEFDTTSNLIKELNTKLQALEQAANYETAEAEIIELSTEIRQQFEIIITVAFRMEESNVDMLSEIISTYTEYTMPPNKRATELVPFVNQLLELCEYLDQIVSCINKLNTTIESHRDQRPGFITAFFELEVVPIYSHVVRTNFSIATSLNESPDCYSIPTSEEDAAELKDAHKTISENTGAFIKLIDVLTKDFQEKNDILVVGSSSSAEDEERFDDMDELDDASEGDEDDMDIEQGRNQPRSASSSSADDEDQKDDYKPETNHIDKIQELMALATTFQTIFDNLGKRVCN